MRVLLLNSPWINNEIEYGVKAGTRWAAIRKKDRSMPYFPFPYYLASATAVLKQAGFDAHIKDAISEEISKQECLEFVAKMKPDLLLIEAFTPSIFEDLDFMKEAKERTGCLSVFSGVHPTALPEEILKYNFMDLVIIGEYDYTVRELVILLDRGRSDFENIKGLAYKKNGSIKINPRREPIKNLDELPFPERDELPMHKYNEPFSKYYPNAKLVTSRGCPYNCIFCTEPLMYNGPIYSKRSVNLVLEEIRILRDKYKAREIFFDDSIFTIPRATEIAEGLIINNMRIAWSCWMDWNINFNSLKLLKESGCVGIKFGVESASPGILKTARKPVNLEKIKELVNNCRKLGLFCNGAFMFGLPGETPETMRSTRDLIFSLKITSCQLAIATPLPGTPFYKMAQENGWVITKDWRKYDCHYTSVIEYPACRKEDIEDAIELARQQKVKQMLKNPGVAFAYFLKLCRLKGYRGMLKEISQKIFFVIKALFSRK